MRKYFSVFRIRFLNSLQYRAALLASIFLQFAWAMVELLAYTAFYQADPASFPTPFSQMVNYVWMQQILFSLFSVVFSDREIFSVLQSGDIAYELVRPMSLYGRWFSQSVGNRLAYSLVSCVPATVLALLMPAPYRLTLPQDPAAFLCFLLSTGLALGIVVSLAQLMYGALFHTVAFRGVRVSVTAVTQFLSGGLIPLAFFPEPVLSVVRLLPFASMRDTPLRIYSGSLAGAACMQALLFQLAWLTALVLLGRTLMNRALKKVVVQGG